MFTFTRLKDFWRRFGPISLELSWDNWLINILDVGSDVLARVRYRTVIFTRPELLLNYPHGRPHRIKFNKKWLHVQKLSYIKMPLSFRQCHSHFDPVEDELMQSDIFLFLTTQLPWQSYWPEKTFPNEDKPQLVRISPICILWSFMETRCMRHAVNRPFPVCRLKASTSGSTLCYTKVYENERKFTSVIIALW